MTARRLLLLIDTATAVAIVAVGDGDGPPLAEARWPAGYRHGEELLPRTLSMLDAAGLRLPDLGGIVVGTGPGAFTGLRVGLATAKGLAHGLALPIAGVSSGVALIEAARAAGIERPVVVLPAGPSDRMLVGSETVGPQARRWPAGTEMALPPDSTVVALDLPERAGPDELARGDAARMALAAVMLRLGAARIAAGGDDLAALVPEYVSLPRGVLREGGPVTMGRA